jgi:hypothetical protein
MKKERRNKSTSKISSIVPDHSDVGGFTKGKYKTTKAPNGNRDIYQ